MIFITLFTTYILFFKYTNYENKYTEANQKKTYFFLKAKNIFFKYIKINNQFLKKMYFLSPVFQQRLGSKLNYFQGVLKIIVKILQCYEKTWNIIISLSACAFTNTLYTWLSV